MIDMSAGYRENGKANQSQVGGILISSKILTREPLNPTTSIAPKM